MEKGVHNIRLLLEIKESFPFLSAFKKFSDFGKRDCIDLLGRGKLRNIGWCCATARDIGLGLLAV